MWGREMPSYLALKDDEGMHIRAALSGEILGRVPCRDTTLKEIRELASKGMKWSVPDYCLDLVGQGGLLLKSDIDFAWVEGAFVDVVVVPRKVVCGECSERLRCFCGALHDKDCACADEVKKLCIWCLWANSNSTPLMTARGIVFEEHARSALFSPGPLAFGQSNNKQR